MQPDADKEHEKPKARLQVWLVRKHDRDCRKADEPGDDDELPVKVIGLVVLLTRELRDKRKRVVSTKAR